MSVQKGSKKRVDSEKEVSRAGTGAASDSHILATKHGLATVLMLLFGSGSMCGKCGYGTRVTSKRWAKCKKCGERVARVEMDTVADEMKRTGRVTIRGGRS